MSAVDLDALSRASKEVPKEANDAPPEEIKKTPPPAPSGAEKVNKTIPEKAPKEVKLSTKHVLAPDRIIMLGACESGKTSLIRNIIRKYYEHSDYNILRCYWYGSNCDSEKWIPAKQRDKTINQSVHDKLTEVMKKIRERDPKKMCIVVWDDVLGESFHKDRWFAGFISTCRHYGIILLIGLQMLKAISPVIRENVQRVYLTSANNRTLDALVELSQSDLKKAEWVSRARVNLRKGCSSLLDFRAGQEEIISVTTDYIGPDGMADIKA